MSIDEKVEFYSQLYKTAITTVRISRFHGLKALQNGYYPAGRLDGDVKKLYDALFCNGSNGLIKDIDCKSVRFTEQAEGFIADLNLPPGVVDMLSAAVILSKDIIKKSDTTKITHLYSAMYSSIPVYLRDRISHYSLESALDDYCRRLRSL